MTGLDQYHNSLFRRIASVPSLYNAWRKVRANRGGPGLDAMSLEAFEIRLEANLKELSRGLLSKSYEPMPARFVTIAKANGKERELAILTVRDRVAQRATLDAIEPLFESEFLDCNFAFRPDRSVEMAIQRMIAARANGFWWTLEADVEDFFGTIDCHLLMSEMESAIHDDEVLHLISLWLGAGALDPESHREKSETILKQGKQAIAGLRMLVRDSVNQSLDGFIADRLGVPSINYAGDFSEPELEETAPQDLSQLSGVRYHGGVRREAFKRILQNGALLALSERALIGRLLGMKLIGIGGVAVVAAMLAPKAAQVCRHYFHPQLGTLQGAPMSPLLTNIYMTPFDSALTRQGWRLIRYCDDFVIQCRSEEEANAAMRAAERALAGRRLRLHPEKTRIVS
ncbi:MAG TPA: reverse transcriptase domain-containing protein, partial [Pyrinomonadaceae bacterium]